jgi:hypothetical protein
MAGHAINRYRRNLLACGRIDQAQIVVSLIRDQQHRWYAFLIATLGKASSRTYHAAHRDRTQK